jgi:hypothetical protein
MNDTIQAADHLEPITIQEMTWMHPGLFIASAQFLLIEPNLEAALK